MAENTFPFTPPGGQFNPVLGPVIASAATIAPTHMVHHVSGVAAIATITPPHDGFVGPLILVADGAWSWTAGGNIAVASTTVATANKCYLFVYDKQSTKWYPLVVAAAS